MTIDKHTHKVEEYNYYHTQHKKKQIILASSLRIDSNHLIHMKNKKRGLSKEWNHFTINREGDVYQHFDSKGYSDFMGVKDIDKHSISIVLENMGMIFYDYESGKYLNWVHEIYDDEHLDPYEQNWKNSRYWEIFPDEQMDATVELCQYLCKKHKIRVNSLGFNAYYAETKNYHGIVCRSNFDTDYNDVSPAFDFKVFLDKMCIEYE